jgi:SNF2 family DNA or RNA helicase
MQTAAAGDTPRAPRVIGASTNQVINDFQDGKLKVLLVQVRMAQGFNLTASHDVIFWGRDWSPFVNRQAEARCHRIGTKGTVQIQIPIVRGTIETMIHRKLMAKEADAEQALRFVSIKELKESL